jgi:glycosyltransferase involved in cell wall biosynthesis
MQSQVVRFDIREVEDMLFAATMPYVRCKDRCGMADLNGALVAHHDLTRAALAHGGVRQLHFFLAAKMRLKEMPQALKELREEFPDREIAVGSVSGLLKAADGKRCVAMTRLEMAPQIAHMRQYAPSPFPLNALVHAVPNHGQVGLYPSLLLFLEEYDAIVATSRAGRRSLQANIDAYADYVGRRARGNSAIRAELATIPLGVDEESIFPRDRQLCRARFGLPPDATVILYVGRISRRTKADLESLVVALGRLAPSNSRPVLVIAGRVGEEDYGASLHELAKELGVADRLFLLPSFPFSDKPFVFGAADIFASPVDNVQETFGIAILEAMAAGLPVVASDWSGYRDLIVEGETGFLVPTSLSCEVADAASSIAALEEGLPNEALAQGTVIDVERLHNRLQLLVENEELRRSFGASARRRIIERFSWAAVMNQYRSLWSEQLRRVRSAARVIAPRLQAGFAGSFRHYATRTLDRSTMLRTAIRTRLNGDLSQAAHLLLSEKEARRVLDACGIVPRSLGELIQSGNETTPCAVAWLLKRAYLEEVTEKASGAAVDESRAASRVV